MAQAVRVLAMDAVERAGSGHPGMPLGMADAATVLFSRFLKFDPAWPEWPDRDRFVLSAGHGSMLLYALLYLTGYARPTLDDLKAFRRLHSPCAGHPEHGDLAGVETTTGPLGQGLAMAVGMALAERLQAARFGAAVVDHHTYVIAGDGCLMEGVSHEAIGLAGHLRLGRLIVLWDDNGISIDGATSLATSEDTRARFEAAGWHVQAVDGHDPEAVEAALGLARGDGRPSLIACRTTIGYGAPGKQGTAASHGAPLGAEEVAAARKAFDWPHPPFDIPADILKAWRKAGGRGAKASAAWRQRHDALDGAAKRAFERVLSKALPAELGAALAAHKQALIKAPRKMATRQASELALEVINRVVPETVGGSADLTGSNNTRTAGMAAVRAGDFSGRYIHYGVREFAMAAAMNGLALHGGVIPYGGTFLVFSDYCRPAIRLSALMRQRVVYVLTHDSIGLGEDGPTHQPVEHLAALRAIPNLTVFRPADAVETAECWELALAATHTPSVIALSRQGLPPLRLTESAENLCARGGYVLSREQGGALQACLMATGSEVHLALAAQKILAADGIAARVVSMPSLELFHAQGADYQAEVLGKDSLRVAVEAGVAQGWEGLVGPRGAMIGMTGFGLSAPADALFKYFGFTP
ncbi:MAG: transketolase, partial [Pseudomonadota bacterium]